MPSGPQLERAGLPLGTVGGIGFEPITFRTSSERANHCANRPF